MGFIDPNWTIANDSLSVTVGINTRIWLLRQEGLTPALIRLGKEHSRLFWKQRGVDYIPNKPIKLISGDVFWDNEKPLLVLLKKDDTNAL